MTPRLRPGRADRLAHAQSSGGGSRAAWVPEAMGLSRVRAVFFDLDNTLIDTAGASRRGMLEVTFLRRRPPLPGQHSAPSNPRQVPVELHSRAWGRVLDSELPRLQSRRHLRSPGLGRRGTRPPALLSLQPRARWAAVGLGEEAQTSFGPGSYITLRGGPGLNLHHSNFFFSLQASLWSSRLSGAETLGT